MPSKEAQIANIRQAYARAGINDLSQTSYFECHGTGTATGDPIETEAIGTVFGPSRTSNDPLLLGSNKPNLGHSEAPSALSSIMKSAFTLETGVIPPTVNIAKLNPNRKCASCTYVSVAVFLKALAANRNPSHQSISMLGRSKSSGS